MEKRFLFIASLPTKKYYFDGERNKSRDILNALKKRYGNKYSVINLSNNQFFQVIKMVFLCVFARYEFIFISKCLVGGSKAIKLLIDFSNKKNIQNLIFYLIGNGSKGFDNKMIFFDKLKHLKHIIVESPEVKTELLLKKTIDEKRISIFPCIKPNYLIKPIKKEYPVDCLRIIYFSRITELKGIMDAITAIINVNDKNNATMFELDIAGGVGLDEQEQSFLKKIKDIANGKKYIHYLGLNLRIEGENSYKKLQSYDLHIFPSKFYQECAPGSVIDMFIAGIPTLSSNFSSSKYLMCENDSFFFEMNNVFDLEKQLLFIYNNQHLLNYKRFASYSNAKKYSEPKFIELIDKILGKRKNETI